MSSGKMGSRKKIMKRYIEFSGKFDKFKPKNKTGMDTGTFLIWPSPPFWILKARRA
jgi:hypothetical protein